MKIRLGHMALTILWFMVAYTSLAEASLAAIAIDFGSQYLKVAIVKPGIPMEIVLNKESQRKTANIVAFRNGERYFGESALAIAIKYPTCAFTYLTDLLGKKFDNPIVSLYKQRFPFLNISANEQRQTVQFNIEGEMYSVETLVAMILSYARKMSEDFAEQPIRDVVITVPAFFNQAERRAMVAATEIAGLNLLQLLNEHSAAGLNYGVFRRKEIGEQAQTLLIYDMGASKTSAAILSYKVEKEKDSKEKNPQMRTLGFGYDRTLGGYEITRRLRDHLVNEYRKMVSTQEDITKNERSMAKMLKEAERLKQVLSANPEHFAQVENLHEEHDFRVPVTRTQLEEMITDLEPRMLQPIVDAMKMAEMDLSQIDQVVLMGAGTRVPKVKAVLQGFFKDKDLGNFLNTDEANAMGAVYQSAHLTQGFKVKKFGVYDLHIFPIQVDFMSSTERDGKQVSRIVHRPIFSYRSFYPSNRKILSFTSYDEDFVFNINYGELKQLSPKQLEEFGSVNVSDIEMSGIAEAVRSEMAEEGTVMKGVKVRFSMDGSGIVHLEGAEATFEKAPKQESAFASIAGKFAGLFSSKTETKETAEEAAEKLKSKDETTKAAEEDQTKETPKKADEPLDDKKSDDERISKDGDQSTTGKETESKSDEKRKSDKSSTETPTTSQPKETTSAEKEKDKEAAKEQKPKLVKKPLVLKEKRLDLHELPTEHMTVSKKILSSFEERERAKAKREAAQNNLETLIYDISDKLQQSEYQMFFTAEEQTKTAEHVRTVRAWLEDEVDLKTSTEQFEEKQKSIEKLLEPIKIRLNEYHDRPIVIAELLTLLNHTDVFLKLSENLTSAKIFSDVEIATLTKVYNETKAWWTEKNSTQITLKANEEPAYMVRDVKEKIRELDREVKYLLNKMKFAKPKVEKPGNETSDTTNKTESKKVDDDSVDGTESKPTTAKVTEEGSTSTETLASEESSKETTTKRKPEASSLPDGGGSKAEEEAEKEDTKPDGQKPHDTSEL